MVSNISDTGKAWEANVGEEELLGTPSLQCVSSQKHAKQIRNDLDTGCTVKAFQRRGGA